MAFTVPPPPVRPDYSSSLRAMRKNTDILLPDAKWDSVKSIASRLGKQLGRTFITRKEEAGVRVWRLV